MKNIILWIITIVTIIVTSEAATIVAWYDESVTLFMLLWAIPLPIATFTIYKTVKFKEEEA